MNIQEGFRVPPLSTKAIREIALKIRNQIPSDNFNVLVFMELWIGKVIPNLQLLPAAKEEMKDCLGKTFPDNKLILLREDVYEGARKNIPQHRFTVIHELGHLLLHSNLKEISYQRATENARAYENSEWQANTFAAEFLMPVNKIRQCESIKDITSRFGVSSQAARTRVNKLKKEGYKFLF